MVARPETSDRFGTRPDKPVPYGRAAGVRGKWASWVAALAFSALTTSASPASAAELDVRLTWYSTVQSLPDGDLQRQATHEPTPVDHNAGLRLIFREDIGPFRFSLDHSTGWNYGDSLTALGTPGLTFDQTPVGDATRAMQLTWNVDQGPGRRTVHRLDRLAVEYRQGNWGVTAGRQAVSWGGGLTFQPFDLFNPFAPTTVDQDFKPGDDLLLVERLFPDGSELQMLGVARRSGTEVMRDASSFAAKYRGFLGTGEYEIMAARHYTDDVYGVGLRIPVGGALVRTDIVAVRDPTSLDPGSPWTFSGILNADYSFSISERLLYVFAEYYRNGFGVSELPSSLFNLPAPLVARIARGEMFNVMRDYASLGANIRWSILLSQNLAWIRNLSDGSSVLTASLSYDEGDHARWQLGIIKPHGGIGEEYGTIETGTGTIGGSTRAFVRFVYYL